MALSGGVQADTGEFVTVTGDAALPLAVRPAGRVQSSGGSFPIDILLPCRLTARQTVPWETLKTAVDGAAESEHAHELPTHGGSAAATPTIDVCFARCISHIARMEHCVY